MHYAVPCARIHRIPFRSLIAVSNESQNKMSFIKLTKLQTTQENCWAIAFVFKFKRACDLEIKCQDMELLIVTVFRCDGIDCDRLFVRFCCCFVLFCSVFMIVSAGRMRLLYPIPRNMIRNNKRPVNWLLILLNLLLIMEILSPYSSTSSSSGRHNSIRNH